MRILEGHKVNPANEQFGIEVHDEPGSGGAHHEYLISWPNGTTRLSFQNGPIAEVGVNGITHEALLAVLIDRLTCFQNGPFSNVYNERALNHLIDAQEALLARTKERMARGVEGTHTV